MIVLPENIRTRLRSWRDRVYERIQASTTLISSAAVVAVGRDFREIRVEKEAGEVLYDQTLSAKDIEDGEALVAKEIKTLGIKRGDYLLDAKCGILFDAEERKRGISTLHNHETGEVY